MQSRVEHTNSQVHSLIEYAWSLAATRNRSRPRLRLCGNNVPKVDVFVTTCGEAEDIILDTVKAACEMDYPCHLRRIIVLDDAASSTLRVGIRLLQSTTSNVYYHARYKKPTIPHDFKAGNLNAGIEFAHTLTGGASEFGVVLDADMIPERELLRALLPHVLRDSKVAMAVPPQAGDPFLVIVKSTNNLGDRTGTTFPLMTPFIRVLLSRITSGIS